MKTYRAFCLVIVINLAFVFYVLPAYAAPSPQTSDAVQQCAKGVDLFLQGNNKDALPLLEAGFNGRDNATFAVPEDLGNCALVLGNFRLLIGNSNGALEAFQVALPIFQASHNRIFEVITLNYLGKTYSLQGQYTKSLDVYQKALAISKELADRTYQGKTLNNIGSVYHAQGQYMQALNYFLQAITIARDVGDREGEGLALNNLGETYRVQGQYDQALELYNQALIIRREVGDQSGEGTTLNNIGGVYYAQGQYAQALEYYELTLDIHKKVGDKANEAITLNNIGLIYRSQGQYIQSMEYYQQALAIMQELGYRAYEGTIINNIGSLYDVQGRYVVALDYYQQALGIHREVGNRVSEGITLNNIGSVYDSQGQFAVALNYYQQALAIAIDSGDIVSESTTLSNFGKVYNSQGQYEQALDYYQRALEIAREIGNRANEGMILNGIGAVYYSQGQYEQALDYYQRALEIAREVGNRASEGVILNSLGTTYRAQSQYEQALKFYQQALIVRREVGDRSGEGTTLHCLGGIYLLQHQYEQALDNYQQALKIAREVGEQESEGLILSELGLVYSSQGQYEQALDYYQQAIVVIEELRAIAGNDTERTSFISQYSYLYQYAVVTAHRLQHNEQAFAFSEQGRARSFLDAITTGSVELSDLLVADLIAREQETYADWLAAQDVLSKAKAQNPPDNALINDLETQLSNAEQAHTEALQTIEARGDELAALVPGRSAVLSLDEIQALLDDQTTLVSYFVIDNDPGALAFIITYNSFSVVELPDAKPSNLKTAVEGLLPSLQDTHPQPLQDLYTWLIAPIKDQLKTSRVGIIPHLTLHYIPFAALTDGQTYLGEQYQLFELPSASSLRYIQQHAAQATNSGAVIFGNPATKETGLPILPYAAAEAEAVAQTLGTSNYTGTTATELQLRESVAGNSVLHLAVHGSYNQFNPLYSTLYLAPDTQYDGRLEVHEIFGLDLKGSQLVVLSACETQLGQLSTGDEVVGMTRAFMFAGAPSVLASLWQVDDEATQVLMTSFYKHWREEGMNKAQALQSAQADVRANPKWESPYYWAAFVLSGDVGTTSIQPVSELTTKPAGNDATQPSAPNSSNPICSSAMLAPVAFVMVFSTIKRRPLHKYLK